ncbi:hypothetical protein ACROYT_G025604 [Oculina patagonica]
MVDPAPGEAGIPAEQQQLVVDEPNKAGAPPQQPAQPQAPVQQQMVQQISVANYKVPPPEKFNFKPEEWPRWIKRFERFRKATGLDQKDGDSQVNTLIYSMGEEADDIMVAFGLSTEEAKQYHVVKGEFEAHFVVKRNVIFERAKFNQRSQQDGESVDNFITDLYCLAEYCEFGTLRDDLIRDRIVEAKSEPPVPASVDHLSKGKGKDSKEDMKKKKKPPKPPKFKNGKTREAQCSRCLGQSHPKRQCPARESKCMKCSKIGHWAKACKSLPDKRVAEVNFTGRQAEGELFLGELTELSAVQGGAGDSWKALVSMNGQLMEFKVDSGADVTVIPPSLFHSLKPTPSLSKTTRVLMGPCKQKLSCLGTFTAKLRVQDKVTQEQVYVIEDLERPLLGREPAEHLKLISRLDSLSSVDYKSKVADEYPKLFKGLGVMKDSYCITLQEDAKPFQVTVPRKVPFPLYQKTKEELDRMLETGVISRVDQPTDWCAPMVVTPKSNGKVRVCVDLSKLNEYVKRENHPLPAVDTTLGRLAGSRVFSKLDANSGFWQIKLA